MMSDIFSIFDPASYNFLTPTVTMTVIMNIMLILATQSSMWKNTQRKSSSLIPLTEFMMTQLFRTTSINLKGMSATVSSLFVIIVLINLMGMIPYSISSSSHLLLTLSIGLPMWLSMLISTFKYSPKKSTAHFLPDGAPEWLNPFLVMIETTSILVRPITLSFRLAANMTAGHIVLTLVSLYAAGAVFSSALTFMMLSMVSMGYIMFELAICMIQAYIFCLLLSLYSDDHAH
nr:ATP synthase F0 subunit 6 [Nais communis]